MVIHTMSRRRNPRVDEAVRQAVARALKEDVGDPRVRHVTVTDVRVSDDHRHATVYYTALEPDVVSGDPARTGGDALPFEDEAAAGLESAAARIQGAVARQVRMRNTPMLTFEPDDVAKEARRIERLLDEVRDERGQPGEG